MSALSDEIREAVQGALAELLPGIVETAMTAVVGKLQIGDAGDELIDSAAAGKLLGMSAATLRRANERGSAPVPAVKVSGRLRWRNRDVLLYLAAQRGSGS